MSYLMLLLLEKAEIVVPFREMLSTAKMILRFGRTYSPPESATNIFNLRTHG